MASEQTSLSRKEKEEQRLYRKVISNFEENIKILKKLCPESLPRAIYDYEQHMSRYINNSYYKLYPPEIVKEPSDERNAGLLWQYGRIPTKTKETQSDPLAQALGDMMRLNRTI